MTDTDLTTQQGGVPVIQEGPGALLAALVNLAQNPNVNPETVAAWAGIQERMEARQAEREFSAALLRIQKKCPHIPKNGIVNLGAGKGSYNFANWEDMDAIIGPILQDEGFTVTFSEAGSDANGIRWSATWRAFGHSDQNFITLPPDTGAGRNALQARGSTNSYAKRYLCEDFLKLVRSGADDDGKLGGTKFITDEQSAELLSLMKQAGRDEVSLLERMTQGEVRSVQELQQQGYVMVKNTLGQIIAQQAAKKGSV